MAIFLFLAVLLNSTGKICCLSYCMHISLSISKSILKQNREQIEETFVISITNDVLIRSII